MWVRRYAGCGGEGLTAIAFVDEPGTVSRIGWVRTCVGPGRVRGESGGAGEEGAHLDEVGGHGCWVEMADETSEGI